MREIFFPILSVLMRLFGLISTKLIEYFFGHCLCKIQSISWKDHPTCTEPMNKPCMNMELRRADPGTVRLADSLCTIN